MASAISCDLCNEEIATLMQTNMENGTVVAVGPSCTLMFTLTIAETILGEMSDDAAASYGESIAPIVSKLAARVVLAADGNPMTGDMETSGDLPAIKEHPDQGETGNLRIAAQVEADTAHAHVARDE